MAKVGAQRAADLTGKSKSTIQRAMNSGKLSYELDANGRRIIDVSELERVFGLEGQQSKQPDSVESELKRASDMLEYERAKMRSKFLEEQIETLKEQLDDMRAQRDEWQKQAQQVLITSQYSQKQAEELKEELKERERKALERRQQMMAERMKSMHGTTTGNQNTGTPKPQTQRAQTGGPNRPHQKQAHNNGATGRNYGQAPATTASAAEQKIDKKTTFASLWHKIKGTSEGRKTA